MSDNHELLRGMILHERYEIHNVIGAGGFGITYRAFDLLLNRFVAVKEFFIPRWMERGKNGKECVTTVSEKSKLEKLENCHSNFRQEAKIMAELKDIPYLSRILDSFSENNTEYIVMKLLLGESLADYVWRRGKLSVGELLPMVEQVLFAVGQMHERGFIHRDICPSNLIRTEEGDLFLIDFGAVTSCDRNSGFWNEQVFSHKAFEAPEHLDFSEQGTWTDIYSLCASIVYLMTKEVIPDPQERFKNDRLPELLMKTGLSARQQNLLLKGLALDCRKRSADVGELRVELCGENVSAPQEWHVMYAARTDTCSREMNQDNLTVDGLFFYGGKDFETYGRLICKNDELHLAAVCDGVGGAHSGELASRAAIQALAHFEEQYRGSEKLPERLLDELLDQMNEKVVSLSGKIGTVATTLSVLFWKGNHYWSINIGDSPIYLMRKRKLSRLSVPQTRANVRMISGKTVVPSDFHTLMNYLGKETAAGSQMAVIRHGHLQKGDIFLICSDGVTDIVDENRLKMCLVKRDETEIIKAIWKILARKKNADNCSAVIVKF